MDPNPFAGADNNEYSSGDEIAKIFEANEDVFDFEKWIEDNKLTDLQECFTEHNMITLETLYMNNPNFGKLMADQRVLIKAHLIQNIVSGIQSLEKLRNAVKKNDGDEEKDEEEKGDEGASPDTQTTQTERRLVFLDNNENLQFQNMQQYIQYLTKFRNELGIETQLSFDVTRDKNYQQIEKYQTIHLNKLDGISHKMHTQFKELHNKLNETCKKLEDKLSNYKQDISQIDGSHKQLFSLIDGKYKHCLSIIDEDKKVFNAATVKCENIIKKYDDDEKDEKYNTNRENEIIEVGKEMHNHYKKSMMLLGDDVKQIRKYIKTTQNLAANDVYSIYINNNIYNQIVDDINKLININSNPQKQHKQQNRQKQEKKVQKQEEKKEEKDNGRKRVESVDTMRVLINDINDMEEKLEMSGDDEDVAFDDIYTVEFTAKPFGLTFGTNEHEKNLFVTTVTDNSLAFKLNVLVGSKVLKIQQEIVRDLGSASIYKIFNNKFGKVLPLKITFETPKEINNIKFEDDPNWFNADIWELTDNNTTIRNKGSNYEPFRPYAIYLGSQYEGGVHFFSVKCVKLNGDAAAGNVRCSIGITDTKRKQWIMKGINKGCWPQIGVYSYFYGFSEEPYWYPNESVIVKLDINNLMVSYFTVNDKSKKKLIKKQQIGKAKTYYFMMCAVSDPAVQYTIK